MKHATNPKKIKFAGKENGPPLDVVIVPEHNNKRDECWHSNIGKCIDKIQQQYPQANVYLVFGKKKEKIHRFIGSGVRCIYNPIFEETNSLYSLGLGLLSCLSSNVLILWDTVVDVPDKLTGGKSVICYRKTLGEDLGVTVVDDKATYIGFGLDYQWVPLYYLVDKDIEVIKKIAWEDNNNKLFDFEALNKMLDLAYIKAIEL